MRMSPVPYVRGQVVILSILIGVASVFDCARLGVSCGGGAVGWMALLHQKYLRDVVRSETAIPSHRARLDRAIAADALITLVPASLLGLGFATDALQPLRGHEAVHGAAAAMVVATLVIWSSSLFDWYLIMPRVSGQLGARPCRSTNEGPEFFFPSTWREVTRWWYIHRVAAALAFRVGLSTTLAVVIGALSGLEQEARWFAGVAMLLFLSY